MANVNFSDPSKPNEWTMVEADTINLWNIHEINIPKSYDNDPLLIRIPTGRLFCLCEDFDDNRSFIEKLKKALHYFKVIFREA